MVQKYSALSKVKSCLNDYGYCALVSSKKKGVGTKECGLDHDWIYWNGMWNSKRKNVRQSAVEKLQLRSSRHLAVPSKRHFHCLLV